MDILKSFSFRKYYMKKFLLSFTEIELSEASEVTVKGPEKLYRRPRFKPVPKITSFYRFFFQNNFFCSFSTFLSGIIFSLRRDHAGW